MEKLRACSDLDLFVFSQDYIENCFDETIATETVATVKKMVWEKSKSEESEVKLKGKGKGKNKE